MAEKTGVRFSVSAEITNNDIFLPFFGGIFIFGNNAFDLCMVYFYDEARSINIMTAINAGAM